MKFSMIVEMTSLTPRVTFSSAAIPAQNAVPASIATTMVATWRSPLGSATEPANAPASTAANRYWPSTPMLNRFIRKPMATATADR